MKHGTCLATRMESYMQVSLGLLARLKDPTAAANSLLRMAAHDPVPTKSLEELFAPYAVHMICDPQDPRSTSSVGVFLELQTCWNRTADSTATELRGVSGLVQIDCPGKPVGQPCPDFVMAAGPQVLEHLLM
mmetsp:Transcript_30302/g.89806  ORF Transcript_30302/g.89806 Transcript_30302/m.89806 type:complete len:132 (+) Transcript_30302:3-398(+)